MKNNMNIQQVYDTVIGTHENEYENITTLIKKDLPSVRNIVDIGCGTEKLTARLANGCGISESDVLPQTIEGSRAHATRTQFYVGDITSFRMTERFDCAVCLFNAVNQLTVFSEWRRAFRTAAKLLSAEGVYIFDINTLAKYEAFANRGSIHQSIGEGEFECFQEFTKESDYYLCSVLVFEKHGKHYKKHHRYMQFNSFSIDQIDSELRKYFSEIDCVNRGGAKAGEQDDVVYFIAKNPMPLWTSCSRS